ARQGRARWRGTNTGAAAWREAARAELERLQSLVAGRLHGGIRFETTAQMRDPGLLLDAIRESIRSDGGTILRARVERIVPAGGGTAKVIADDGSDHAADIVLVAAGFDSGRLLRQTGARVPI